MAEKVKGPAVLQKSSTGTMAEKVKDLVNLWEVGGRVDV